MPPPAHCLLLITLSAIPTPALLVQIITFNLIEEQPINISVGAVTNVLELDQEKTDDLLESLRYSFLPKGYPHSSLFRITDVEGEIFATQRIDREELCGFSTTCVLSLEAVVQSASFQLFKKVKVNVKVVDINDNAPKFPSKSVNLEISESVSVNSSFAVEGAIDPDTGPNALQTYDILRADGMFDLDIKKNLDGGSVVNLIVKQPLDREQRDFYRVYLMAKDGGVPRKSSLLMVNITVNDINDNAPVFPFARYNVSVTEVVPIGHVALSVTATDADAKDNWRPFYRLSALQAGEARKFFNMNPRTGEISVISSLTEIQGRTIVFVIECVDGDTPPLVGQSEVEIFVQDTENTMPVINLNLLNGGTVSESFRLGTVVAHLAVSDPDSGRNGFVKCSITSATFEMQHLDVNEYKITLKRFVDKESESDLEGLILCQDEGEPSLNTTKHFIMNVRDENDNVPKFTKDNYEVTIEENKVTNNTLVKVTATDSDHGVNGKIHYSIVEGKEYGVHVSQKGEITALAPFDREENSEVTLTVMAIDGGDPPQNATATVTIYVVDVNDYAPTFSQTIYSFEVDENMNPGTVVGRVEVYDLDEGRNGEIFLNMELLFEDVDSFPITIDQNGELKTTRPLDRETEGQFEFVIVATDNGREEMSSTAKVFVDVTDLNDNSPEIYYPTEGNNTVYISHNLSPGSILATVDAFDNDWGNNSYLSYILNSVAKIVKVDAEKNDENEIEDMETDDSNNVEYRTDELIELTNNITNSLYSLDSDKGEVTLARSPRLNDVGFYTLHMTVFDQGTPTLSANTTMNVEIVASNETIFALLTGPSSKTSNATIVTALGCLTGIVIVVVVVIISTVRMIDREKTLSRQRQLHVVKVEPRDNDIKYEGDISELGSKLKRPLPSPKLSSQVSHGWKFLSAWHLNPSDNKMTSAANWTRNKNRKVSSDSNDSGTSGSDSGKGGSDDENHSNETSSLQGNSCDRKLVPSEECPPEPEYSVVIRPKDRFDSMQSKRLLPKLDEISLPDDIYADYCSLDTIKEEPESPFKDADFKFEHPVPVPKLRQPKKLPRTTIKEAVKESEGQGLVRSKSRNDLRRSSGSSEEETLKRASVDGVSLKCGDSVIFDLDLQKVDDIYV